MLINLSLLSFLFFFSVSFISFGLNIQCVQEYVNMNSFFGVKEACVSCLWKENYIDFLYVVAIYSSYASSSFMIICYVFIFMYFFQQRKNAILCIV